jgi:CubicO group peptidase (beta-lactamase class C family)
MKVRYIFLRSPSPHDGNPHDRNPPLGWAGGGDYGLGWEAITEPLGELAGHLKGTYGHDGLFGTQGWIDPKNGLISILLIRRRTENRIAFATSS